MISIHPIRPARQIAVIISLAMGVTMVHPAPATAQVMYSVTDLGTLGGTGSFGWAINSSGQVAGVSRLTGNTASHAFRTMPGGTLNNPGADLGTLEGMNSEARGINALGQVVGFSNLSSGVSHAFRTLPSGLVSDPGADLGAFNGASSTAYAINASGQVTGVSNGSVFRTTATGTLSDPGANIGGGFGYAINDSGQVAGWSYFAGIPHAFRTTPTGLVFDPGTDLGTLGGQSRAYGINNSGQVTGFSDLPNGVSHAFRTSPTGLVTHPGADLGALGPGEYSEADAINSFGVVVGASTLGTSQHAIVYDTMMRNLDDLIPPGSGWALDWAYGINDAGWITGEGFIGGQQHAFLLIPTPEPSSFALAGAAIISGWLARRRRTRSAPGCRIEGHARA